MTDGKLWIDGALCLFLLVMGIRCFLAPTLHEATVSFIAFGLAASLSWSRLAAPDVALAEAAIGTSLFGVLLLDSIRVFRDQTSEHPSESVEKISRHWAFRGLHIGLSPIAGVFVFVVLIGAVWHLDDGGGLTRLAGDSLPLSGVEHGVTAVLLNYRIFDTWLELAVLFVAWIAILAAGGVMPFKELPSAYQPDTLTSRLLRILLPVFVIVSGYLLWAGKAQPGGAFQAGVVLAAAFILARLGGHSALRKLPGPILMCLLLIGMVGFFLHGLMWLFTDRVFLEFAPAQAGTIIFLLELAATISIGLSLALFFIHLNQTDRSATEYGSGGKGSPHD